MITRNATRILLSVAVLMVTTTAGTAQAATVIWDGSTDTDWSADPDTTSWSGGTYNDGDDAQFNGAGAGAVNITGAVSPGSVSVTSGNYTFADGGGSIGGTGTLSKSGGGILIIVSFWDLKTLAFQATTSVVWRGLNTIEKFATRLASKLCFASLASVKAFAAGPIRRPSSCVGVHEV